MALTPATLVRVVKGPSSACAIWRYTSSADALATIVGSGYFNSQAGKLALYDIIHVSASDGHRTYAVTARTATTVTIVAFT